jgi:hypothetical protein
MFSEIESTIIDVLQRNLETVPKQNISSKKLDLEAKKSLPAISIENLDFEADEVGVGRSVDTADKRREDFYDGDGKRKSFETSEKPVRPVLSVEHPAGTRRRRGIDYTIDYEKGIINFRSPPAKGEKNIVIRYQIPIETKGVKFRLRYHINVWSQDEAERNEITVEVIKALLREEETFNRKGMLIKPLRGFNISQEKTVANVSGKTLEYLFEAYLQVEVPVPRIEKVEIKEK